MATAQPQYIGLIGHPLSHSRSPVMQQAALDALGIAARYELWDTPASDLSARVARLRQPEMLGANITIPYKTAVIPFLDDITPEARTYVGAVNTIVRKETATGVRLVGYNTDLLALRRILRERSASVGGRALVLGAGGAARAAVAAAFLAEMEFWIAARHREQAEAILNDFWRVANSHARYIHPGVTGWLERAISLNDDASLHALAPNIDVVINATPIGTLAPTVSPLAPSLLAQLPSGAFVFDMVYNPPVTALVRAALARGLRAEGGLAMLLYQGAESFYLWTGHDAPLDVMRAALDQHDEQGDLKGIAHYG